MKSCIYFVPIFFHITYVDVLSTPTMQTGDGQFNDGSQDTKSRYLKAISHPMRRRVLDTLLIERGPLELRHLTHSIVDATENSYRARAEQVRITLYHQHLPSLEDAGLIEFDEHRNHVEITAKALRKLR